MQNKGMVFLYLGTYVYFLGTKINQRYNNIGAAFANPCYF
jgi:Flp pilus assembly pilin Flp